MAENELIAQERGGALVIGPRYVSIFEDPDAFAQKMQIAAALSKTQFVPVAFRNKPEDCLVALDMAARLGMNPLAVFPEIYVIDARAAFSSKFLIALVNRSGRFSRIVYDEGVDGEAAVTFASRQRRGDDIVYTPAVVPNYYAVARFTELATGHEYTSPRIDLHFAEKNGWVAKVGSKWQSMPEIMVRYRAASTLIKSVAPELVLGLEFAEDLMDTPAPEPPANNAAPRRVYVAQTAAPAPIAPPTSADDHAVAPTVADEIARAIATADTAAALKAVGARIKKAQLSENELRDLRVLYARRRDALQTPAAPVPIADAPVVDDPAPESAHDPAPAARLRADDPVDDDAPAARNWQEVDMSDIEAQIHAAQNVDECRRLAGSLAIMHRSALLTESQYFELGQLIDEKAQSFET